MPKMRRMLKRSSEFVAGALCAAALLLITLGGAGLLSAQVFLGPKRDYVGLATSGSGQRDVSVDSTTSPPRLEVGRSVANGLRITGAATGSSPTLTITGDAFANLTVTGAGNAPPIFSGRHDTGIVFLPAPAFCWADTTNLAVTRVAAGDWALARTATGAETINIACSLNFIGQRSTSSKGIRPDALALMYEVRGGAGITSAALTTHTITGLYETVYANATANAITSLATSGTLATATQTTPYRTAITITNAAFTTTANSALNLEIQAVLANTSIYRLYGLYATYSHALY